MDQKEIIGNLHDVVDALVKGSTEAFDTLYFRFVGKVYNFLFKVSDNQAMAEDLTQETFIKLWCRRESLDPDQNVEAWLMVCAKNLFLNDIRQRNQHRSFVAETKNHGRVEDFSTVNVIDYHFAEHNMAEIVNKMPAQRRKIFVLSKVYGLSAAEIAEQMGISKRTVENQLYQAHKQIYLKINDKMS